MSKVDNKKNAKVISIDAKFKQENEEVKQVRRLDKKRLILFCSILFAILSLGAFLYLRFYKYTKYNLISSKSLIEGSLVGYESFDSNILRYSKDGATYMTRSGKEIWVESYEMKDPIVAISKKYLVIAERKGNKIITFSKDGKLGEISTLLPISKVVISDTGIVATILEDNIASYISFYDYDAKPLAVGIKSVVSGDGYPTDLSISPNGKQLMVAYEYFESGELKGRVVFYDFSEIGKNVANRLVGGFEEPFSGSLIARVKHFNATYSFAVADTGIYFFSLRNLLSPELIKIYSIVEEGAKEIYSIAYNDKYLAVVYKNINGEVPYRLEVYRDNGSILFSKDINLEFTYFDIDEDNIYFSLAESELKIYNMAGILKLDTSIETSIKYIEKSSLFSRYTIFDKSSIQEIQLK